MGRFVRTVEVGDGMTAQAVLLGPLEEDVMKIMWALGTGNVREVASRMERPLAYTTVMTTLDRLFKKGLLTRESSERAYVYTAAFSRDDWNRQRAGEMMAGFLTGPEESRQILLSCLVDAVGSHDALLLDELEEKIRRKREELANRER